MAIFKVEGGRRLSGEIKPQGAKNEALQILCATLLTEEKVVIDNIPQILDIIHLIELLQAMGVKVERLSEECYSFCAKDINLGEYILLGKGEEAGGGRERNSIISDVFEAIVGAIYIDGGFELAKEIVAKYVLEDIGERQLFVDSKGKLILLF